VHAAKAYIGGDGSLVVIAVMAVDDNSLNDMAILETLRDVHRDGVNKSTRFVVKDSTYMQLLELQRSALKTQRNFSHLRSVFNLSMLTFGAQVYLRGHFQLFNGSMVSTAPVSCPNVLPSLKRQ
jgi:hypothetical protein